MRPDDLEYLLQLLMLGPEFSREAWDKVRWQFIDMDRRISGDMSGSEKRFIIQIGYQNGRAMYRLTDKAKQWVREQETQRPTRDS